MKAQQIERPAHPSTRRVMTLWENKSTYVKSKHIKPVRQSVVCLLWTELSADA
jgi:hypothetical protein